MREICKHGSERKSNSSVYYVLKFSLENKGGMKFTHEDAVRDNPVEYTSVTRPVLRDSFFKDLQKLTFEEMNNIYANDIEVPLKQRVVSVIKETIKTCISGIIRRNSDVKFGMLFTFQREIKGD